MIAELPFHKHCASSLGGSNEVCAYARGHSAAVRNYGLRLADHVCRKFEWSKRKPAQRLNSHWQRNSVIVDAAANTLEVDVSFSGITSGTTASHIHCCISPPGATGVATTTPTFVGFPLGVTTGVYNNTLDLLDAGSYNPAFITANGGTTASAEAALLAGIAADQAYLNIHSNQFPGGEIRGFLVVPTPEPSTLALAGFALTGLVLF